MEEKAPVRGLLTYGTYRLLGALTGPLPPRAGYGLARSVGPLLYRFSPKLKRVLTHNMSRVLGLDADSERVQFVVRQAFVNIAKGHYDLFRLSRLSLDEIRDITQIEGQEHADCALARGKGVVLVSAHFGNVDILGQMPLAYGVPFSAPALHIEPERMFRYTLRLRQSHGIRMFPSDGPMMELFRALKRGEMVGLPCDRAVGDNTREVDFFGSPARLPDGPVRVALRTGAALIPAFGLRMVDETFLVRIEPQIELPQTGDREANVAAGMEKVVEVMERYISQHPEQWLVAAPIWPME
jgi:KDO2-lipid IV(A) lauroyltransferase